MQKQTLAEARPDLVREWDQEKNGDIKPQHVQCDSKYKVWWKCKRGHEWETTVRTRTNSLKCKYCLPSPPKGRSFAECFPSIALQWHPKNNKYEPYEIFANSNKKFWWQCPIHQGHVWETTASHRANGFGCPYCAGKYVSIETCFGTLHPKASLEWHPTKNGSLTPYDVTARSEKSVWWQCSKNSEHVWESRVHNRGNGSNCPYCAGQKVNHTNSLRTLRPDLTLEWHPIKNGDKTPDDVGPHHAKHVWWQCVVNKEHEWQTTVDKRVSANRRCPFCSNQKINHTNSFASQYPEIAAQWHPTKNSLTPKEIAPASSKRYWWQCSEGHIWQTSISSRTKGKTGCAQCSGFVASPTNNLLQSHPKLAEEWDWKANYPLEPTDVLQNSEQNVGWKCQQGHQWKQKICSRTRNSSQCFYCNPKKGGEYFLKEHSLGSLYPNLLQEWHTDNKVSAFDVLPHSSESIIWKCSAGHIWSAPPKRRTSNSRQSGCFQCFHMKNAYAFQVVLLQYIDEKDIVDNFSRGDEHLYLEGQGRLLAAAVVQSYFTEDDLITIASNNMALRKALEQIMTDSKFVRSCSRPTTNNKTKLQVHLKDDNRCQICTKPCDEQGQKGRQLDHFVPWVIGGEHSESNFWTLCWECNIVKYDKFPNQFYVDKWIESGRKLPNSYHELLHLYQVLDE